MQVLRIRRYHRRPDDHSGHTSRIVADRIGAPSGWLVHETGRPFSARSLRGCRRGRVRRPRVPDDRGERRWGGFLITIESQSRDYHAGGRRRDAAGRLRFVQSRS